MNNIAMLELEVKFHWTAVAFYVLASVLFAYALFFRKEKPSWWAVWLTAAGLLFHSVALGLRWRVTGHGPYLMDYEILSSNAWIVIFMFLVFALKHRTARLAGAIAVPLGFLMMTVGLFLDPAVRTLPPTLKGFWLIVHVIFNFLAVGALIIATGASGLYLIKEKRQDDEFFKKLPPLELLDSYSLRFTGLGFLFWSIMIVAGAIWANQAWGRYWGWDPVETWSLVTWLLYGFYLHARKFLGWRGRKAAWILVLCFALSIFSIYLIPFTAKSLHTDYFQG